MLLEFGGVRRWASGNNHRIRDDEISYLFGKQQQP